MLPLDRAERDNIVVKDRVDLDVPPPRLLIEPGFSRLQISDSTADVVILRIAGGPPERSSHLVLEGNQGGYPAGAASAQILLTSPRQRDPNALPPMPFTNCEPVHVPSPPVPAGNQSTDNLTAALGDQNGSRGVGDQALDVI